MVFLSNASIVANTKNKTLYKWFERKFYRALRYADSYLPSGIMSPPRSVNSKAGSRIQAFSTNNKVHPEPEAAEITTTVKTLGLGLEIVVPAFRDSEILDESVASEFNVKNSANIGHDIMCDL